MYRYLVDVLLFCSCLNVSCLYICHTGDRVMMVELYVDDLLISGSSFSDNPLMKLELIEHFDHKYVVQATVYL